MLRTHDESLASLKVRFHGGDVVRSRSMTSLTSDSGNNVLKSPVAGDAGGMAGKAAAYFRRRH